MMVDTPKLTRERLDSLAEQIANLELHEGKLEFRNVHGLTLKPAPERGNEDLDAVTRWLNAIEPELDGDNHPKWDGSRLDLDAVLSWMFAAEARAAA